MRECPSYNKPGKGGRMPVLGMGRLAGPSPHPPGAGAHPRVQAVGRLPQVLQGALHELERVTVHARAALRGDGSPGGGLCAGLGAQQRDAQQQQNWQQPRRPPRGPARRRGRHGRAEGAGPPAVQEPRDSRARDSGRRAACRTHCACAPAGPRPDPPSEVVVMETPRPREPPV